MTMTVSPTLNTLATFNGTNGKFPGGNLIADNKGDLFGITQFGGANGLGTVFEITKAGSLVTLVSFNGSDGANPVGGLIADAHGNLFGTTEFGGASNDGTVFEITKTGSSYASTPTTLVSFNGSDGASPLSSLIFDANGDLLGTTESSGANNDGTVFGILNNGSGYASTPTTLVSFNGSDGANPVGGLIADANGNLFGTTLGGGANGLGTVFEITKTGLGYSSTPTTLVSFNGTDGNGPAGSLIFDANGDLLGTTESGGANNHGTVFGILNTGSGYASIPTTLVSFNGSDGNLPAGSLIMDAQGDLFGTTFLGGANNHGTVFEIINSSLGFASTPTTLVDFNFTDGANPVGGLIADNKGDLFGTTEGGGANGLGTVFQITGVGFDAHQLF
jgi:uncharacterized repeat protein (TIGR03803 family)